VGELHGVLTDRYVALADPEWEGVTLINVTSMGLCSYYYRTCGQTLRPLSAPLFCGVHNSVMESLDLEVEQYICGSRCTNYLFSVKFSYNRFCYETLYIALSLPYK
jgi:hypothetical protein